MVEALQRAALALGTRPTMSLADLNEERVELVEQPGVGRQVRLESVLDLVVTRLTVDEPVAAKDAGGVGVDNERRQVAGIQQNGVGRLTSDPRNTQQLLPQRGQR